MHVQTVLRKLAQFKDFFLFWNCFSNYNIVIKFSLTHIYTLYNK